MFGPKLKTVFASRWKALWWSAGILLTAYCSVPGKDETGNADDAAQLAQLLPRQQEQHKQPVNPWALDPRPATPAS